MLGVRFPLPLPLFCCFSATDKIKYLVKTPNYCIITAYVKQLESKMGFETLVLNRVEEVLGQPRKACFFNGSLFVECDARQARKVFSTVFMEFDKKIQISGPVQGEYIIDFVV